MNDLDFLRNITWTPLNIFKAAATVLIALFLIMLAWNILSPSVGKVMRGAGTMVSTQSMDAPAYDPGYADEDYAYEEEMAMMKAYDDGYGEGRVTAGNIGIPSPLPPGGGTVGDNAEDFEATEYNASFETRDRDETCAEIAALKRYSYVVFENANERERGCSYTFKVEHERVEEILLVLEALGPKTLSENTYTIKRQLDDFTSETEILQKKLDSIDETLVSALDAYDEITQLATSAQDATALAKIFDSKINIIERLTQERINVAAQLERMERRKAEQLDKLNYTYFYVDVFENKFIDGENLADSWKAAVKNVVRDVNRAVQDVTINLIALVFLIAQWLLYAFIALIVVKYGWKIAKYVWKK